MYYIIVMKINIVCVGKLKENYFINAYFWTSTAGNYADYYRISYNAANVDKSNGSKYNAYALRCVRD